MKKFIINHILIIWKLKIDIWTSKLVPYKYEQGKKITKTVNEIKIKNVNKSP
jgi:hypothetical protein